jgi:hypothetical protein
MIPSDDEDLEFFQERIPAWTLQDMLAALAQGWGVFGSEHGPCVEGIRNPAEWGVPAIKLTDDAAMDVMREAVARGEVHALKAWHALLPTHPKMAEWDMPE